MLTKVCLLLSIQPPPTLSFSISSTPLHRFSPLSFPPLPLHENSPLIQFATTINNFTDEVYFTIKPSAGIVATSFTAGDKVCIGTDKLLPIERFLPQPKAPAGAKPKKRGGAGGRGGARGGRGQSTSTTSLVSNEFSLIFVFSLSFL